jgi:hypothetical protein
MSAHIAFDAPGKMLERWIEKNVAGKRTQNSNGVAAEAGGKL